MRRFSAFFVILGLFTIAAFAMQAAAQEGPPEGPPPGQGGPDGGGPGGRGGRGGPRGGFHLIPPFAMEKMNLSDEQKTQIADLEKQIKAKLAKILTPEQLKALEQARPPRMGQGGGRRGQRGGPGGDQGPDGGPGGGPPGGGPGGPGGGGPGGGGTGGRGPGGGE